MFLFLRQNLDELLNLSDMLKKVKILRMDMQRKNLKPFHKITFYKARMRVLGMEKLLVFCSPSLSLAHLLPFLSRKTTEVEIWQHENGVGGWENRFTFIQLWGFAVFLNFSPLMYLYTSHFIYNVNVLSSLGYGNNYSWKAKINTN